MSRVAASILVVTALVGCVDNQIPDDTGRPPQCNSAVYVPFDEANHAEQDGYTATAVAIHDLLEAAIATPADAAVKFTAAAELYTGTPGLQGELQGRADEHFTDKPNVGQELDARITAALADGAAATDALDVEIWAETVDKSLTEFFFLSVIHELRAGRAKTWDEAFGYYGAGADNDAAGLLGFSAVALRRDQDNGTALEPLIFQKIIEGSCALADKLAAEQTEAVDVFSDPDLTAAVTTIDEAMIDVIAYSVGHEALELAAARAADDDATARVKLVELDLFFRPLERLMLGDGGDSATRAEDVRVAVDAALAVTDNSWLAGFDVEALVAAIEDERGIDVKE